MRPLVRKSPPGNPERQPTIENRIQDENQPPSPQTQQKDDKYEWTDGNDNDVCRGCQRRSESEGKTHINNAQKPHNCACYGCCDYRPPFHATALSALRS